MRRFSENNRVEQVGEGSDDQRAPWATASTVILQVSHRVRHQGGEGGEGEGVS